MRESRDNKLLVNLQVGELYSMLDGHKCGGEKNRARCGGQFPDEGTLKFLLNYMYLQKSACIL